MQPPFWCCRDASWLVLDLCHTPDFAGCLMSLVSSSARHLCCCFFPTLMTSCCHLSPDCTALCADSDSHINGAGSLTSLAESCQSVEGFRLSLVKAESVSIPWRCQTLSLRKKKNEKIHHSSCQSGTLNSVKTFVVPSVHPSLLPPLSAQRFSQSGASEGFTKWTHTHSPMRQELSAQRELVS